jgi:hypothetical protein
MRYKQLRSRKINYATVYTALRMHLVIVWSMGFYGSLTSVTDSAYIIKKIQFSKGSFALQGMAFFLHKFNQ